MVIGMTPTALHQLVLVGADLLAVGALVFGVYFPRHHRRDLVAAFLGVNVGVLAVAMTLSSTSVGIGLGMGLFGVLSIIRLRSYEIAQHEIAYYFSALAIGLLNGLPAEFGVLTGALTALIVATMYVGDHPRLFPGTSSAPCAWTPPTPTTTPCAPTWRPCWAAGC